MKAKEIIGNMVCTISDHNINIKDSYKITDKSKMREILYAIQYKYPACETFKRSYTSLLKEWRTHNRLYKLGMWKSHTSSVDLNYPIKWYVNLIYNIFGI